MTQRQPKIGLLPLYLKLYDDTTPEKKAEFAPFLREVVDGFVARGVEVSRAEVCRVKAEFRSALATFERQDVDLIVTLHLAYSPSLESVGVLETTKRPLLILDTTMDSSFGRDVSPDRIMYNHGVHGVMDLASMLRRHGKSLEIVAGHLAKSQVMDRAAAVAKAAYAARCFRTTKALRIGQAFKGMGDFSVEEDTMARKLGITVTQAGTGDLSEQVKCVKPKDVKEEMEKDRQAFVCKAPEEVHERSVRVGLGVRRMLEEGRCSAFSMNFLAFDKGTGPVDTVPLLEASKGMARGVGYSGEGDVLTAAMVGALCRGFGRTTFTEVFCPDWKGGNLFLSHMGEVNPEISSERPRLIEKPFPFTPAKNPAVLTCSPRQGAAVFVNLAPGPKDSFSLILAPVQVLGDTTVDAMRAVVRAWVEPSCPIGDFLEEYSRHGGTHHSALVLGSRLEELGALARFAGLDLHVIGSRSDAAMDEAKRYETVDLPFYRDEVAPVLPPVALDFHAHTWSSANWRDKPWERNPDRGGTYMVTESEYPPERLLQDGRRCFPDRPYHAVCFGYPSPVADWEKDTRFVAEAGKRRGLYPLMLAGRELGVPEKTVRRQIEEGAFLGYKVFLNWIGDDYGDKTIEDMLGPGEMGVADRLGLVVLLHVPRSGRLADPVIQRGVERLAKEYPSARIVLAHCGRCYLPAEMRKAIGCVRGLDNVWLDTSMVMDPVVLEIVFDNMPCTRVLFATDFPVAAMRGRRVRVMDHWVDVVLPGYPKSAFRVESEGIRATFMATEIAVAIREAAESIGLSAVELRGIFHDNGMAVLQHVAGGQRVGRVESAWR